jgi:hypothetical protein
MSKPADVSGSSGCYNIQQAADVCRQPKRDAPVDFLAVVVNISAVNQHAGKPTVTVWIVDPSIPEETKALVTYWGKKYQAEILEQKKIRIGDVVRFNRVSSREDEVSHATAYRFFYHSSSDPEAGPEFWSLCNVERDTGAMLDYPTDPNIPESMRTDPARVVELVKWFRESKFFDSKRAEGISPLPCQHRSLAQLQSTTGSLSHVMAMVTDVQTSIPILFSACRKRKHASTVTPQCLATLTDDGGKSVMTFLDTERRFQATLEKAVSTKRPLRFSRVVSRAAGRTDATVMQRLVAGADQVFLVPTRDTVVKLATKEEEKDYMLSARRQAGCTQQEPLSMTQPPLQQQQGQEDGDVAKVLLAPLVDISVNGISLVENRDKYLQPTRLASHRLNGLFRIGDNKYRDVELTVRSPGRDGDTVLQANGKILQVLCGGLDLDEWGIDGDNKWTEHGGYGELVIKMLSGLIDESVQLRWNIDTEPVYRVSHVTLPRL